MVILVLILGTANKLKTARQIALTGAVSGSTNFDGSGNVNINTTQSNIKVLSGSVNLTNGSGMADLEYPSGYNSSNCVPISIGCTRSSSSNYYEFGHVASSFILGAYLNPTKIQVKSFSPNNVGPTGNIPYKLVLMKIS